MSPLFVDMPTLENERVLLRPIITNDIDALTTIAFDSDTWAYMETRVTNLSELKNYVDNAINERNQGVTFTFVIFDKTNGKIAGSTRYGFIYPFSDNIDIGWTWIAPEFRGTGLNHACKDLMINYAFDKLGLNRIGFSAEVNNHRSRRAIEKLGAQHEGTLRQVFKDDSGKYHHLAVFGLLKQDWKTRAK